MEEEDQVIQVVQVILDQDQADIHIIQDTHAVVMVEEDGHTDSHEAHGDIHSHSDTIQDDGNLVVVITTGGETDGSMTHGISHSATDSDIQATGSTNPLIFKL